MAGRLVRAVRRAVEAREAWWGEGPYTVTAHTPLPHVTRTAGGNPAYGAGTASQDGSASSADEADA